MRGCPRCHVRLNAPVQGLEDNIQRYTNSPVVHVAFLAPYKPSNSPDPAFSSSHFQTGVVRIRNKVHRGTWPVVRCQRLSSAAVPETDIFACLKSNLIATGERFVGKRASFCGYGEDCASALCGARRWLADGSRATA